MENTFSCTVERASCNSVVLSSDAGNIEKFPDCNYLFRPSKLGESKIIISIREKGKTKKIGAWIMVIKEIPDPVADIGGLNGGDISKGALNALGGIGAGPPAFLAIDADYEVKSFVVSIIRNGELIYHHSYNNNAFSPDIHEAFKLLQKEDRVVFSSITVQLPDKKQVSVKPLEFIISN